MSRLASQCCARSLRALFGGKTELSLEPRSNTTNFLLPLLSRSYGYMGGLCRKWAAAGSSRISFRPGRDRNNIEPVREPVPSMISQLLEVRIQMDVSEGDDEK